jgi:hypothetical protein
MPHRGTWFDIDYRPLPVDEAEKVEEHHLMVFFLV